MSVAELEVGIETARVPRGAVSMPPRVGMPHLMVAQPTRPALSTREIEVLLAWMAAESKEDAATKLFISQSTVSTHISRIRAKYAAVGRHAPTKAHLLARALQDGYTTLEAW
ncbi:MAG: LuxR C-terminal-related transcriptional regulator [Gordonia sp. (in: high G+C Gram-positive bacteria)]|uniref:response regulator transcription factor n=1 Tax=Gordonia TaxID=2053 RepID=UPI003263C29E